MKKIFLISFTNLFITTNIHAADFLIEALRGDVKNLVSNKPLVTNEILKINDLVATGDHSFVRIKEPNGGLISLGPNSKIKLNIDSDTSVSMITLMKGQVRSLFDKKSNPQYKYFIKTKSASMGIRGTDFHVIYNEENNVSTVLTYEGNVEFTENHNSEDLNTSSFNKTKKVSIPPGSISGVFYNEAQATPPIKISPLQFAILKKNTDLLEGNGQKIAYSQESLSQGEKKSDLSNLSIKDSSIIPVPKKFLIDEYFDDKVSGNPTIKSGGYIDLKTGIYIHPPEDSEYDAVNDVYHLPVEFGGIDETSGEYISPPGLILSPIKGFMFTTNVIQKGFHTVTSTVTSTVNSVVTPITDGAQAIGNKTIDVIKNSAISLRDNTGVVGSTIGSGVELVGDGIKGTLNIAEDSSSLILNKTANTLNYLVHETFLSKIKDLKENLPIVNFIKIKAVQVFDYNHINTDKFNMFDTSIERHGTVRSQTDLDFKIQKSFYTNFFIRPHLELKNSNYIGDNLNLKSFDETKMYYGSDFGYSTNINEMKYQTYFSIERGNKRKPTIFSEKNIQNETSWRFSFNKLILGQKKFSTTFGYQFEEYDNKIYGKGKRHLVKISEIISINELQFIRLSADWNRFLQNNFANSSNWSLKTNFYLATLKWNMNLDFWTGIRFLYDSGTTQKRNNEMNYFAGTSLTKSFENNFSVNFAYELLKQTSPDHRFKYLSQSFLTGLNYNF